MGSTALGKSLGMSADNVSPLVAAKQQQDKLEQEARDELARRARDEQTLAEIETNRNTYRYTPYGTGGGRKSTILTGPMGLPDTGPQMGKTLLGS